ncbi:MAG: DUF3137 domain-containing protein [Clostridium sp.]|nr:DUF3137 domain-containing protein [Clostridium sp.]
MGRVELNGAEILHTLEPLRKKWNRYNTLGKLFSYIAVFGFIGFTFSDMIFIRYAQQITALFPVVMIVFLVNIMLGNTLTGLSRKTKQQYADTYKRLISRPVLDSVFEDAVFEPGAGYPQADFKNSKLMPGFGGGHTYTSEDLIIGTCNGAAFQRADVKVTHRSDKKTVVDVDGRLLEVAFPKQINGMVRVVKEGAVINLMGADSSLVEMEDADFNRKFNVYADDKHSAFYLLTPQFMEYIKKLYNRDNCIAITFDGEKLYFLQSGHGGIFEPPEGTFNAWDEVRKCREELSEIREIIEILQVDDVVERERLSQEAAGTVLPKAGAVQQPEIILGVGKAPKAVALVVIIALIMMMLPNILFAIFFSSMH